MNKISWPLLLGVLGALLTLFSAIQQWHEKKRESDKSDKAQAKLESLQTKTLEKAEELNESYKENLRLQADLNKKSDSLLSVTSEMADLYKANSVLQNEVNNFLTGEDTKPYINIFGHTSQSGDLLYYITNFNVLNTGKYPLHDLIISITDFPGTVFKNEIEYKRGPHGTVSFGAPNVIEAVPSPNNKFTIGTLTPGQDIPVYSASYREIPNGFKPYFTISANWSGGSLTLNLKAKIENKRMIVTEMAGSFNGKEINVADFARFYFHD